MSSTRRTPVRRSGRLAASLIASLGLAAGGVATAAQPATAAAPAAEPTSSLLGGVAGLTELRDYIVTVDPAVDVVPRLARQLTTPLGGSVLFTYDEVLNGFAVRLPAVAVPALRALPLVETVSRDKPVVATAEQPNATWGLDRTDQQTLPLDSTFGYADDAGQDAHVYVIDSGLNANHAEFTGRVGVGRNFVAGGFLGLGSVDPQAWTDCNGHGTHVASTAAGTTWGVAKKATVHGVRVLDCAGRGSAAVIVAGIDWVAQNAEPGAVANISIGSLAPIAEVDAATAALVDSGVAVAVAAGNDNTNACRSSPAASAPALTVGATTRTDARSSFSNFGSCVDLFGPGTDITAANYNSSTGSTVMSGTSMASPHVAGVLALVRSVDPTLSGAAAQDVVLAGATPGKVTNPGTGSPNLLLWSGVAVDDPSIDLIVTAAVPRDRADIAIRAVQAGKDVVADKPGVTTLDDLAAIEAAVAETDRRWWVMFGERFENRAVADACRRARLGDIGRVVSVLGLGPHRMGADGRPDWFWEPEATGGILVDIGSHQADQFLMATGAGQAEVVTSAVGNVSSPRHPAMQDIGQMVLTGGGAVGTHRVDYLSPSGLKTWGDGRLVIVGTDGTMEVRTNIDIAGRKGKEHLIMVDGAGTRRIDVKGPKIDWARRVVADVAERSDTFVSHDHVLAVCDVTLRAQAAAAPWPEAVSS